MATIGSQLRAARERLGLTQVELAEKVGVSATTIVNWETGLHRPTNTARLREVLDLDEQLHPRRSPGSPPDRYDFPNMDDQQLAARMTALLAELTALTAEVTLRLGASDIGGRAETPAQAAGRAQPPARTGRYDYVITMEDLERLEADDGKSDDGRSSTG